MWQDSRSRTGHSFPELIVGVFVVVIMFIPVYSIIDVFTESNTRTQADSLVTKIKMDISLAGSQALACLKEQKIVYNKGDVLFGFTFVDQLYLKVNHFGQIEAGDSAVVGKSGRGYIIKVKPVSGSVTVERQ